MNALRGRAAGSGRQARSGGAMSLNLTPMIDVVFLLLFFFLTVSQFRRADGMLPAQLPAQAAAAAIDIPRTPIRIRFVADTASPDDCRVKVERFSESAIPIRNLAAELKRIQEDEPGFDSSTPVHLLAGDDIRWDHVVNAYNAALSAEYEKVFFAAPR
jgi:biopolymer transport protein ExbD